MKKHLRTILSGCMIGGMLLGATMSASAEPAGTPDTPAAIQTELALLGPDRSPRAPQRAVKAPVQRPVRTERQTVVTPPPPPVKPFVYEKMDCKTLTNTPYDLNGNWENHSPEGPTVWHFDNDRVHVITPTDEYVWNRLGAMGADREFLNLEHCQRLGVWVNGRIEGQSTRQLVSDMTSRLESITCGEWSEPMDANVAGIPVTKAVGYDEFGNYYYEVYAWERFGNTYAFATRIPYTSRYNTVANAQIAYMITHAHPAVWVE